MQVSNSFPPDLCKINELIKQAHASNSDGVELATLIKEGIQYWEQQDINNLTSEQQQAFDRFDQIHKYITQHQLEGIDKALYS